MKDLVYKLLTVISNLYPIWFVIGIFPWSFMVEVDTDLWSMLVYFQIGGLIFATLSYVSTLMNFRLKETNMDMDI